MTCSLGEDIKDRIDRVTKDVTKESLVAATETVILFQNLEGFKEISDKLMAKVVKKAVDEITDLVDFSAFYNKHINDNPDEVAVIMKAVSLSSSARCSNCLEPQEKCMHGQSLLEYAKPHIGLRFKSEYYDDVRIVDSVVATKARTQEGDMIYDVTWKREHCNYPETSKYPQEFVDNSYKYFCKD